MLNDLGLRKTISGQLGGADVILAVMSDDMIGDHWIGWIGVQIGHGSESRAQ